jgi:CheY-like chemotaxis protein
MQRIVLIEEDPERRRDAAEVLRAARYQVSTCPEPRAAFARVCEIQPDLVILNLPHQHRTGCQVLNQLKQQEETQAIPVLLAWSAGSGLEPERHTLVERGVHLLAQPLLPNQLPRYVADVLGADATRFEATREPGTAGRSSTRWGASPRAS